MKKINQKIKNTSYSFIFMCTFAIASASYAFL